VLEYFQVVIPVIALSTAVVVQILVSRSFPGGGLMRSFAAGVAAGFVALLLLAYLTHFKHGSTSWTDTGAIVLVDVATYLALAFCFLSFLNLGITSIRIQIFNEVEQCKEGLSLEELHTRYDSRRILNLRLERLLRNKQVIAQGRRYVLGGYVLWLLAKAIGMARWVVMGKM